MRFLALLLLFCSLILPVAQATPPAPAKKNPPIQTSAPVQKPAPIQKLDSNNDPFESVNRVTFGVNDFLDQLLIRPLAELYRYTVPPPLRTRLNNVLSNSNEPVSVANSLLQGKPGEAGLTLSRFLINTTLGIGGLFDVATDFGLPQKRAEFGQTLAVWGMGSGPYLVLPFFGPSNVRDAMGLGADAAMWPWGYVAGIGGSAAEDTLNITSGTTFGLTQREKHIEDLDTLRIGAIDFYAQMRSVAQQHRAAQLGIDNPSPVFEEFPPQQ